MAVSYSSAFVCVLFLALTTGASSSCTWPTALAGTWYTSQSSNWTFDSTSLTLEFATYGMQNFECYYTDGYRYLGRITNIQVFPAIPGYLFDIFLCLEFQQLGTYSFLYWRSNNVNPSLNNEKAYMRGIGFQTTTADACEISKPYTSGTHEMLIKLGYESSAAVTCPYEFNSVSYYYYDYDVVRSCGPSNSSFDGCTATNTLSFNYSACADSSIYMLYSNVGALYCLYFTTDSGNTYLTVYNQDSNPDGSTYYRFSCLMFAESSSVIRATQHPEACQSSQTTTYVASPGVDLYFGVQLAVWRAHGSLTLAQDQTAVKDPTTGKRAVILRCGPFSNPAHHPKLLTPNGANMAMTMDNATSYVYQLTLDNVVEGPYKCFIPGDSSSTASITVDETAVKLLIIAADLQDVKQEQYQSSTGLQDLRKNLQRMKFLMEHEECMDKNHAVLSESSRSVNYGGGSRCDSRLVGWYRFKLNGTDAIIPTSCVQPNHCGTQLPTWLNLGGKAMPAPGETAPATACVKIVMRNPFTKQMLTGCCNRMRRATVVNCDGFFVYHLNPESRCYHGNHGFCSQPMSN